jgi:paraquat-inducible protein B
VDEQQLREHLDELNAAITELKAPKADKEKLTELITDIEQQINEPMFETDNPQTLVDQVDSLVTSFEQDHPAVSGILNNIMLTLSSMGV